MKSTKWLSGVFILVFLPLLFIHKVSADPSRNLQDYQNWILQKMQKWSPIGKVYISDAQESYDEATERYNKIAHDAMAVAFDPSEKPLFHGKYGRSQTLAVLLSVSWWESRYRRDIDFNIGKRARGDHGKSWCMMQIKLGNPIDGSTPDKIQLSDNGLYTISKVGWSGQDLIQDRQKCFRAGLHMARNSFHACANLPVLDRLGVYTSSSGCTENQPESRARMGSAIQWLSYSAPPLNDSEISSLLRNSNVQPANSPVRQVARQEHGVRSVRE